MVIRRWTKYRTHIMYTKEYRTFMKYVGQCIKQGGAVTMTTYVGPDPRRRSVHERLDATLDWSKT